MSIESQLENERRLQSDAIERRKQYLQQYKPLPNHREQVGYVLTLTQLINECQTRIDYLTNSNRD